MFDNALSLGEPNLLIVRDYCEIPDLRFVLEWRDNTFENLEGEVDILNGDRTVAESCELELERVETR